MPSGEDKIFGCVSRSVALETQEEEELKLARGLRSMRALVLCVHRRRIGHDVFVCRKWWRKRGGPLSFISSCKIKKKE